MDTSRKCDEDSGGRATRRLRTLDEKLRIVAEASQPGASVAAVARKHELNANLLFAWRRLHRRGLLEGQRHAPPLLPVQITSPTVTPTRRTSRGSEPASVRGRRPALTTLDSFIEIVVGSDTRIRLRGEAQRAVLARILGWLPGR
jgi:transposase